MTAIGRRSRQLDWDEVTSGRARYVSDLDRPGCLVARILRAPHPHASITALDVEAARRMPGVRAVITARDLPLGSRYMHAGPDFSDRPPLATEKVCFVGQEVAAVAAESAAAAEAALAAIRVRYKPLPAPLDPASALRPGAPILHRRRFGPNLPVDNSGAWGDPHRGLEAAAVMAEGRFYYPRVAHACMEPSTTVACWELDHLELWTTTQSPWYVALELEHLLGIPIENVTCHDVRVGGGFGARSRIGEHEVIAALLARHSGRPVSLTLSREEEFAATKSRHAFDVLLRSHATADGRICLIEADQVVENGAYNHLGPHVSRVAIRTFGSLYRPDGVRWHQRLVDTAVTPGGAFRGYGGPQAALAHEVHVDELAVALGIDPIEMRIANANRPYSTAISGLQVGSARLVECLEQVRDATDWGERYPSRMVGRGLGVAAAMHQSGVNVGPGTNESGASVELDGDGKVRVAFGSLDTGTGQRTILAQFVADELGVDVEAIDVVMGHGPSIPPDAGAWASRGTHMGGHAVGRAASGLARRLRELAAAKFDASPELVALADGQARVGDAEISLGQLVALADDASDGVLRVEATYREDRMEHVGGHAPNVSASYAFCAHVADVEVDELTGQLRVVDYVAAHDVGRAINPTFVEGQIIGGVVQALGVVQGEEIVTERGKVTNPAFINYPLPRASDVPDIRVRLVEGEEPAGPSDAKGVGEIPLLPVAPAVSNAVYDAVGVRLRQLPFTPDRVTLALAARDGRSIHAASIWRRPSRWWIAAIRWLYPRGLYSLLDRYGRRRARPASEVQEIVAPANVSEVIAELVGPRRGEVAVVGGNTDLAVQRRQGLKSPLRLVSLRNATELHELELDDDGRLSIGAGVTLARLAEAAEDAGIPALVTAIREIATPQVRQSATVGGNLLQAKRCWFFRNGFDCYKRGGSTRPCYAVTGDHRFHHAIVGAHRCQAVTPSDLASMFLALDAEVTVARHDGVRQIPIERLYSGPGETVVGPDELLTRVTLPSHAAMRRTGYSKLALWHGDFAVVASTVSGLVDSDDSWHDVRIVLGGAAPTPLRLRAAERRIEGQRVDAALVQQVVGEELRRIAHPLEHNVWKLSAAEGVAARAAEAAIGHDDRLDGGATLTTA